MSGNPIPVARVPVHSVPRRSKPSKAAKLDPTDSILTQRKKVSESILQLSSAASELRATAGLNSRAIIILLHHETKISMKTITDLLNGLERLKQEYTE